MNVNLWNNEYNPFQKFKVLCHFERMKKIKTGNFDAPVNIALDIIQGTQEKKKCGKGFNCNFCMSSWEEQGEDASIPKEILLTIPEFYNIWGVKSICLAGHHSDPTMYNNSVLIDFMRLCNKWNIEIGIVSNGAYYSKHLLVEVARTCRWSGFSVNAGTAEGHEVITRTEPGTFDKVIDNMKFLAEYCKEYKLDHDIGYKYLITDDNYKDILTGIKLAKDIGVRHFQLRPTDLPIERSSKIDVQHVEDQIKEGLAKYEKTNEFEIFGIREKFTAEFTKKAPYKCIASPLGSTWMANGDVVICPDRRWSAHQPKMRLGNFITDGLEGIRRKWGSKEHHEMIAEANRRIGECHRCTSWHWNDLYKNTVENDVMDLTLI